MTHNIYQRPKSIQEKVNQGEHREVVGGAWEEMGKWQLDFMRTQGLAPHHRLLDIGCGSLRGGVHLIDYLHKDRYSGIDAHKALLDAGYHTELLNAGLQHKLDRSMLIQTDSFDFSYLASGFDFALAVSLFTHLDWNHIRLCLNNLVMVMKPGSKLYATYFESPEKSPVTATLNRGEGISTSFYTNPYHYSCNDLEHAAYDLPISIRRLGDVGHPRGQFMAEFRFNS